MRLKILAVTALAVGLVGGSAMAQMAPIPNPPEPAPAKPVMHHKHKMRHKAHHHAPAKPDAMTPAPKSATPEPAKPPAKKP